MFLTLPLLAAVFPECIQASFPVPCSLSLFRSLPLFSLSSLHLPLLSWRLRLLRSDALKGRSLSHREGLYQSLHGGAGALAANIQLLQVAE